MRTTIRPALKLAPAAPPPPPPPGDWTPYTPARKHTEETIRLCESAQKRAIQLLAQVKR